MQGSPQADLACQQSLAREAVESHAHQHHRDHDHQQRKAPKIFGLAEDDEGGLSLQDDRHRQDDERSHHVGRAHGARVEADDHRTGYHRGDLADRGQGKRDKDREWKVAQSWKDDQAVHEEPPVAQGQRHRDHRDHLACVDLGLPERRGKQDLQRGAVPLTHKRLQRQHQRKARGYEDDKERAYKRQAVDDGCPTTEVRKHSNAGGCANRYREREGDHGRDQAHLAHGVAQVALGYKCRLTPIETRPGHGGFPQSRGRYPAAWAAPASPCASSSLSAA